jgi:hypothetical protein
MNAMPQPATFPGTGLAATPYLEVVLVGAIVALCVIFAMLLWSVRSTIQRRQRVICPDRRRAAKVTFALGPAGNVVDVLACSLEPAGVRCAKTCLHAPMRA